MPRFSSRFLAISMVAALLASCTGGDDGGEAAAPGGGTTAAPAYAFVVTGAEVQAMAPAAPPFPDELVLGVKAGLDAYLSLAVVEPLRSGSPPTGLEGAFTAAALGRLAAPGPDRAALLEEGAPLTGPLHQDRANARLTALTAPGGDVVLVTAQVDVGHTVRTGERDVDVVRTGELVMVADGGAWRIDAFNMRTARDTR